MTGLSLGITVLISRYIGEKKQERIGKVIGGVIWFFAILAVILTIALLLAAVLAKLMQAPEAVLTSFCSVIWDISMEKEKRSLSWHGDWRRRFWSESRCHIL